MNAAKFILKEITQDWNSPFKTKIDETIVSVSEGESFSDDKEKGFKVFKLLKVTPEKALIEFSNQYTLKGHEHPENRQIWIDKKDFASFSSLWSQKGLTKKLMFKEIDIGQKVNLSEASSIETT